ncbi:MAG: hypothetical protein KC417_00360, partial [Myxococcales bacterium]|nr:hypothetical protein [Myxococcales bacterium]
PPPPPPPPAILAPREITTEAGFDLVATGQGAALFWAPPASQGGGIRMVRLNSIGGPFGEEAVVYKSKKYRTGPDLGPRLPVEVSAATGGGRVAVAWVLRDPLELRIGATYGNLSTAEFAPAEDWGKTELVADARERSAVATAAAPDGTLAVIYRTLDVKCKDDSGNGATCASFAVRRLGGQDGEPNGGVGVPLQVPRTCPQPIVGHVWSNNTWYYGICSKPEKQEPVTTQYAIQFEPQYAVAERILANRTPLGIAPVDGGVIAMGRGAGFRDAVQFADNGRRRTYFERAESKVTCVNGRPVIAAQAANGAVVSVPLTEPRSRLESLLSSAYSTDRARAVWTGKSLLVGFPMAGEVVLHRYECLGDQLERSDL